MNNNQLEKHVRDFIYDKLKHDNIEIVSINKNYNIFIDEIMLVVYNVPVTNFYSDGRHYIKTYTNTITTNELNKFISSKRDYKINSILE